MEQQGRSTGTPLRRQTRETKTERERENVGQSMRRKSTLSVEC